MNARDRLTAALLSAAARRWPADLREDLLREWAAEVHVLRSRPFAALRFAVSLACSPAVEADGAAAIGWRERLPGAGRALQVALALLCVGAAAPQLVDTALETAGQISGKGTLGQPAAILGTLTVLTLLAAWLGGRLGRSLWIAPGARAAVGSAAIVVVLLGRYIAYLTLRHTGEGVPAALRFGAVEIGTWILLGCLPVVAYVSVRAATGGRRILAALAAVGGTLVLLDGIGMLAAARSALAGRVDLVTAPLWFPLSVVGESAPELLRTSDEVGQVLRHAGAATHPLLVITAFALGCAVGLARPHATVVAAEPAPAVAPAPWASWLGLGAAAAGVLAWAAAIAFITPAQLATAPVMGPQDMMTAEEFSRIDSLLAEEMHTWLLEQQLLAILLATLGVVVHLARRGPALLPAALFGLGLAAVDMTLARNQLAGPAVFLGAVLAGGIAVMGAAALSTLLGRGTPDPVSARRALLGAAVLAALCAPVPYWQGGMSDVQWAVAPLCALTALTGVLLTALAGATALAGRAERPTGPLITVAVVVPTVAMAVAAGLVLQRQEWAITALLGAPLLGVLTLAAGCWVAGAAWRPWLALGAGALVVAVPLCYVQLFAGLPLGAGLVVAAGYVNGSDSMPYLTGALLVGVPLAAVAAIRATAGTARAEPQVIAVGPEPVPELS